MNSIHSSTLPATILIRRLASRHLLGLALCALLAAPAPALAISANSSAYVITDLGAATPSPAQPSAAFALTQGGAVVGQYALTGNVTHAYLWVDGNATDLGTLGGDNSTAVGIANVDGSLQIVGNSQLSSNTATHAFVWTDGNITDLGTLPTLDTNTTNSFASGINSAGNISGSSETGVLLQQHAFLWTTSGNVGVGNFTDLGVFSGGNISSAAGLNDGDVVVGSSEGGNVSAGDFIHGFYTGNDSTLIDVGTLDGTGNSTAIAINRLGAVVGDSATASGNIHGFTFNATTALMTDIGLIGNYDDSHALAVNTQGDIVGYNTGNFSSPDNEHAFIYHNTQVTDLNTLTGNSGWVFNRAYGINDRGQIVGVGLNASSQQHAFLLTEKPPKIISQPLSVAVVRHGNVTLVVQAFGAALNYQWFKNDIAIRGAENATLTLSNVTISDQAKYHVVVSNSAGLVVSDTIHVKVIPFAVRPHPFVMPPVEFIHQGDTAQFRALVIGSRPMSFQWQKDNVNLTDTVRIHGSSTIFLTIESVTLADAGRYRIVVTNPAGSAHSEQSVLHVR